MVAASPLPRAQAAAVDVPMDDDVIVLRGVPWEVYEALIDFDLDRRVPRISYDEGELELVSPSRRHERAGFLLSKIVQTVCEALDIDYEPLVSTTLRQKKLRKGFEADSTFYFSNLEVIRRIEEPNLMTEPPPDLVIEIDASRSSMNKLKLYSSLGITEVWRWRKGLVSIHSLADGDYLEADVSAFLPDVNPDMLSEWVGRGQTETPLPWTAALREWASASAKRV